MKVQLEIKTGYRSDQSFVDTIVGTLVREAPVSLKTIEPYYEAYYKELNSFTFDFADPLAISNFLQQSNETGLITT